MKKKAAVRLNKKPRLMPPPSAPTAEYVDIPTAAALVAVSSVTIRRRLTENKLQRYKFGSRTLIRVSQLSPPRVGSAVNFVSVICSACVSPSEPV